MNIRIIFVFRGHYTNNGRRNAKNSNNQTFHEIWYRWISMIIVGVFEKWFHGSSNDQYSELNPVEIIAIEVIAAEKYQLFRIAYDYINHGP